MELYVCINKEAYNGKTHYLLRNIVNNKEEIVDGDKLKRYMTAKKVDVMNLTLTSDNRLVEASRDKIAKLDGILKAPLSIRDRLQPLNTDEEKFVEDLMDDILKTCIENYVGDAGKYCRLKNFDKDKNTCIMEFTLGLNSYLLLAYDKTVYGIIKEPNIGRTSIYFDIGIQLQAISNRRASSKIGDGSIIKASEGLKEEYIEIECVNGANGLQIKDGNLTSENIKALKRNFGKYIMHYVSAQLTSVCENNPDIANNTEVGKYINYDNRKKEYVKDIGFVAAVPLVMSVAMTAIFAFGMATNPEIIQTGLLAKIANVGTTSEIIKAMGIYAGGMGTVIGGASSIKIFNEHNTFKTLKENNKELKELKNEKRSDWMGIFGK